jgi:predicted nucleic acid-binding protein
VKLALPDPDDLPFLETAVAARAEALVTGNPRHFRPKRGRHNIAVLPPSDYLDHC